MYHLFHSARFCASTWSLQRTDLVWLENQNKDDHPRVCHHKKTNGIEERTDKLSAPQAASFMDCKHDQKTKSDHSSTEHAGQLRTHLEQSTFQERRVSLQTGQAIPHAPQISDGEATRPRLGGTTQPANPEKVRICHLTQTPREQAKSFLGRLHKRRRSLDRGRHGESRSRGCRTGCGTVQSRHADQSAGSDEKNQQISARYQCDIHGTAMCTP